MGVNTSPARAPWHRRAHFALRHSLRWRLMMVFFILALVIALVFATSARRIAATGWNLTAKPLLVDYIHRLADEVGTPPDLERARALTQRLPITLRVRGPQINWDSQPNLETDRRQDFPDNMDPFWIVGLTDGHTLSFGVQTALWEQRGGSFWVAITVLLAATALAYRYLRRLLRPLDAIGAGARRFGAGDFSQPIALHRPHKPDELTDLARTVNTMGQNIHDMLEAKRALLLAISHELRSPITRARLHTELLPEDAAVAPQRSALMRDLAEMSALITDLLESERLSQGHSVLHRETVNPLSLAQDALFDHPKVRLIAPERMADVSVDAMRVRLLLRNLLGNAIRHAANADPTPELHISASADTLTLAVRDFGPGVDPAALAQLGQAFYRPDDARTRSAGGVGLGLYLCRLIAQAHGGALTLNNAQPGLRVVATLRIQP
jgi:signal transduction histidine kinase